jgi:hypothetical protein
MPEPDTAARMDNGGIDCVSSLQIHAQEYCTPPLTIQSPFFAIKHLVMTPTVKAEG